MWAKYLALDAEKFQPKKSSLCAALLLLRCHMMSIGPSARGPPAFIYTETCSLCRLGKPVAMLDSRGKAHARAPIAYPRRAGFSGRWWIFIQRQLGLRIAER